MVIGLVQFRFVLIKTFGFGSVWSDLWVSIGFGLVLKIKIILLFGSKN